MDLEQQVELKGKGNANIVVTLGGEENVLYRLSIRYEDSLEKNNEYTLSNWKFISKEIRPILGDLLCPMELVTLIINGNLRKLYSCYVDVESSKDHEVQALKLPNLRPADIFSNRLYKDHQTVIYSNPEKDKILLEIKPKWLHNSLDYCRNCTHNKLKGRKNIDYCYRNLLTQPNYLLRIIKPNVDFPRKYIESMSKYFALDDNVLQLLYREQEKLYKVSEKDDNLLPLLMTLRDVTCFVEWDFAKKTELSQPPKVSAHIIDVDVKPSSKKQYWANMENTLNNSKYKVIH